MSNPYFRFKQFTVWHDKCAMKVGTDGVLLGAWVPVADNVTRSVLDVGAGTGLVALMIAQRNTEAEIDAVEIDKDACIQASENVEKSPFKNRIKVIHQSFPEYAIAKKYDLIVSNPPFFAHSLKSPDQKRNAARHNDTLPLRLLIGHATKMLSEYGRIALILPAQLSEELDFIIATHGLYQIRRTDVISAEGLISKRFLIELSSKNLPGKRLATDTLVLETNERKRTLQYQELTKDFYL
ncbi:MAG: methyltransferase [Tannerella sp.]|jgi:tRNA1Val (adenine37-N6)-methyltransferase|nr:methyltransferase [Tannerella sp.]